MVALHWDLGRGWEKFEGKDEEECLVLAMKSRGFKIKDCEGSLSLSYGAERWHIIEGGEWRVKRLLEIIRENLPFGVGKFEKSIGSFKYEKSLSGEKKRFNELRAVSLYIANNILSNDLRGITFSLSGIDCFITFFVSDDESFEGRKILSSHLTIYKAGSGVSLLDKNFYIKFFEDIGDENLNFLSDRILEKMASAFFTCFDDELCEKLREVSNRGRE